MSTVSVPEAASLLKVHENTVLKLIAGGDLPAARIWRSYVMLERDVLGYAENMIVRQTAARMGGKRG